MDSILTGFISAFWLGILTSISPCPLATNVAAVSFLLRKMNRQKAIFLSGLFYVLGRMFAYALLGFIIIFSIVSVPVAANFLQRYMNKALGPVLIITGLFLLGAFKLSFTGFNISDSTLQRLGKSGAFGTFLLGILFALSFCPISAALFFGSLIPLSLGHKFGVALPFIYGIGTGLPVFIFALLLASGIKSLSYWFGEVVKLEIYARKITGIVFILTGIYYLLAHVLYIL